MPEYCDVAVPVPLDAVFTYRVPDGIHPPAGGRVLVPFRQQRLVGIVTELHDRPPKVSAKNVMEALDEADAQIPLELSHPFAELRLRLAGRARCGGEASVAHHLRETMQIVQVLQ